MLAAALSAVCGWFPSPVAAQSACNIEEALLQLTHDIEGPVNVRAFPPHLQVKVEKLNRVIAESKFNTSRHLMQRLRGILLQTSTYESLLGRRLIAELEQLGPDDLWIDAGAGTALAAADFYTELIDDRTPAESPRVIAVTIEDPDRHRTPAEQSTLRELLRKHRDRFSYLVGRPIERIPPVELGQAQIITDPFGAASYSLQLDHVMRHYLRLLAPGGHLFMNDPGVVISDASGRTIPFEAWLSRIEGYRILERPRPGGVNAWVLERTESPSIRVPELELVDLRAPPGGTGRPARFYLLK